MHVFYSFVLYFLCAYFMTILPLPSRESLNDMRPISELMLYDRMTRTRLSYGCSKRSLFGIRVLDILPLEEANVDRLSETVCDTLYAIGFGREAVTKVRLMTEGVLLEWMNAGLRGTPCELRLDKHFCQKALILSIPAAHSESGPGVNAAEESYMDMLSQMTLHIESYRASQKNVCIIHIP